MENFDFWFGLHGDDYLLQGLQSFNITGKNKIGAHDWLTDLSGIWVLRVMKV